MRYEDACHRRAALAEAKRREDALAEEQRHLDEAQRQEDALAEEERHRAVVAMHCRNEAVLAAIEARQEQVLGVLAKWAKEVDEQRRHEAVLAAQADKLRHHEAVLAAQADGQRWHEAAARAAESAALTLVEERHRHEPVLAGEEADEQRRYKSAARAAESDAVIHRIRTHEAAARAAESAALTLVEERRCHEAVLAAEEADEQRRHESAARAAESDAVIDCIRTEFSLYAAPLDAILAEIACKEAAFKTKLSPRHPTSYVDAVLSNMGGGTQPSLPLAVSPPALVPAALPSPDINNQRQTVRPRARPCRHTGRRNIPQAPSSSAAVAPTHPDILQVGLPTLTSTTLAGATSPCRSVVSSTPPGWTTPDTPSLQPFTFDDGALHSSGGGNAHPFRAQGLPLPPWKRTIPPTSYLPATSTLRSQSIYWMGLGGGAVFIVFF